MSGKIKITLATYLEEREISRYKIIKNCNVSQTQLNRYYRNQIERIDLDVLARICDYLNCEVSDLLEYVPDET
ncbi:MAG: helix-turn-helix transcriptional regulator [Ruminococcus sp.]|nr:helix-turn-helix transcriptional regulator [Ruminococcus sp.]MDE6671548.1 helix-turn-helix transcriptional regulator [Ruminococcus sp.]